MGSPDAEPYAGFLLPDSSVGAKHPIAAVVGSLMEKIGTVCINRTDSHGQPSSHDETLTSLPAFPYAFLCFLMKHRLKFSLQKDSRYLLHIL